MLSILTDLFESREKKLVRACRKGNLGSVKKLIKRGVNIECCGEAALEAAYRRGLVSMTKYLIKHGARAGNLFRNCFYNACFYNNLEMAKSLIENENSAETDLDPLLLDAIEEERYEIVEYLIEKGADVHYKDEKPIRLAVEYNYDLDIAKFLVENGADTYVAVQAAVKKDDFNFVKYLFETDEWDDDIYKELLEEAKAGSAKLYLLVEEEMKKRKQVSLEHP
jgi:ankyrin repeat protein